MNNAFTQWVWRMWCEYTYLLEEIDILYEHPTRKMSRVEVKYHFLKLIDEICYPWYCLKRGVRNFKRWFTTIWGLDVYDHSYLFNVIDKQLEDMEEFFAGDKTHCCGANHRAKRIRWTRKLLKMHRDETYNMKHYEAHSAKYGRLFDRHESKVVKEDEYGIPLLYSWECNDTEEEREEYRQGMLKARDMDEKVWKLFMKNLSRCREWWD